jgi:dipeptidyl aminopeptidase/acylaminoacyl peptidase
VEPRLEFIAWNIESLNTNFKEIAFHNGSLLIGNKRPWKEPRMKKLLALCLTTTLVALPAVSQKRAFTIADLYHIKSIEDPQYSPDGRQIAFVVSEDSLQTGKTNAEIYVMDANGANLRQMTDDSAKDTHPRWSPDGKKLLFLSARTHGTQAWLLPLSGGQAEQVTDLPTQVANPEWTHDGKGIIFSSNVYPECGADTACNRRIQESMSNGPLRAHMADHLLYRHWTTWKDGKRTHMFIHRLDTQATTDLSPGDHDAPSFSLGGVGFAVSPDGKEVCFVSNHDTNEAETTNKDLWVVPTAGGQPVNITAENRAYDGDPAYSPDGRYIAYRMQVVPGYESDRFRLALYDRERKTRTVLSDAFDNWVTTLRWAPDSRSIYFTADVQGTIPLYMIDITSMRIREVVNPRTTDAFAVAPDGKTVTLVRRSVGEPRDLWQVGTDGRNLRRLTFFNKPVENAVDIRPAEEIWINSPTDSKIQTYIVKPHGFDPSKKYPLILNVHGGPQDQWTDGFRGDWQVYPGSGYIVAFPNPHGSTGFGQAFTAEISKDWTGKVYQDIMAVADSLEKIPWVDKDRIGAMGWSYGGFMMMWLEGHTNRFKAIASMMGVYDLPAMFGATEELWFPEWDLGGTPWDSKLYDEFSPNRYVKNFKTPCLVITGEMDFRVPYTQSLEFFTDLQKMNVPSRLIVFSNDGHWPSSVKSMPFYYNAHLDWFHKYLGGPPAPYDMVKMLRNQTHE